MSSRFCDNEDPCPMLKKAVSTLLPKDWAERQFTARVEDGTGKLVETPVLQLIVVNKKKEPMRVFLEYCPFCGTRIDPKFLSTLKP